MMNARLGPAAVVHHLIAVALALFAMRSSPVQASTAKLVLYIPHTGTPVGIPNFVSPAAGCNWSGVGGQIFSQSGSPVAGMVVKITGIVEGKPVNISAVSGSSLRFGPGGFDIQLADHLISAASIKLSLIDLAGRAQSGEVPIRLDASCGKNLTVVNMVQKTFTQFVYLPHLVH